MAQRILFALSLALLLAACGKTVPETPAPVSWEQQRHLPPDEAWAAVSGYPESRHTALRLELLESWADERSWETVNSFLDQIEIPAEPIEAYARLQKIRARARIAAGDTTDALAILDGLADDAAVWKLRTDIYERLSDEENWLRSRLHHARLLPDANVRRGKYRQAWNRLLEIPGERIQQWRDQTQSRQWRGWLDLALLARPGGQPLLSVEEILNEWELLYAGHPAREWLPVVQDFLASLKPPVPVVAALLPLTGSSAHLGRALQAGITERARMVSEEIPDLYFYDTGDPANTMAELYRQALEDGAERIIGPLQKHRVSELLRMRQIPVPVISLNYLESGQKAPESLLQFGLLPEDEVLQVAQRARQNGHKAALVFAPNTRWGRRLSDSFTRYFEQSGGTVKELTLYYPGASSYADEIKTALKLADGERRHLRVEEALGRAVQTRPSRRQDVDMVFLASSPRNARMIKPQIDYYYADDLPIYATSHIYGGSPSPVLDQDLERVRFCDVPMVFAGFPGIPAHSEPRDLPRLVALGADAYLLAHRLPQLETDPDTRLQGWTGTLTLQPGKRVYRHLPWAQFRRGRAVLQKTP